MQQECIGEPVSWLRLEMYDLNELPPRQRDGVDHHLQVCAACRSSLESIRTEPPRWLPRLHQPVRRWHPWRWFSGAVAMAAGLLMVMLPREQATWRTKGSVVTWELLREHEGTITTGPLVFATGDRFKILLSCGAPEGVWWDVAVWQAGVVRFPLPPGHSACGNNTALPGALQISGHERVDVCLLTSDHGAVARDRVGNPGAVRGHCIGLAAE